MEYVFIFIYGRIQFAELLQTCDMRDMNGSFSHVAIVCSLLHDELNYCFRIFNQKRAVLVLGTGVGLLVRWSGAEGT